MKTHTGRILIDSTRGMKFTESPRWRDGRLWFLDIHDKRIKTADLGGRLETVVELPFLPNALGFRGDGSLLFGDAFAARTPTIRHRSPRPRARRCGWSRSRCRGRAFPEAWIPRDVGPAFQVMLQRLERKNRYR